MRRQSRAGPFRAGCPVQGIGLVRHGLRKETGGRLGEVRVLGRKSRLEQRLRGKEGQQREDRDQIESVRQEIKNQIPAILISLRPRRFPLRLKAVLKDLNRRGRRKVRSRFRRQAIKVISSA